MRVPRYLSFIIIGCGLFLWSAPAKAFPWMVKHGYNNCATCHVNPSGAGLLTEYGRAQSVLLLSSRYGNAGEDEEEPGKIKEFLFGALPLPTDRESGALNLGGFIREAYLWTNGGGQSQSFPLYMQQALDGHFQYKGFHAYGSIGYVPNAPVGPSYSEYAWVTDDETPASSESAFTPGNLIAPVYWLGYDVSDAVLVRVGRLNLPFGLRDPNHVLWVRSETRTDYNQDQQVGVDVSVNTDRIRAEVIGIAGNYQVNPDALRERGYAGYIEYNGIEKYAFGLSSLITYADANLDTGADVHTLRQAHGVFTRFSPTGALAVTSEADLLVKSPQLNNSAFGFTAMLAPDLEIVRGVHGIVTGEVLQNGYSVGTDTNVAGRVWLTAEWFVYTHLDLRFDVYRQMQAGQDDQMAYLLQAHIYL